MKLRQIFILTLLCTFGISIFGQEKQVPVIVYFKNGESLDAVHLGKKKCGNSSYMNNFVMIKGKFMDNVTEIKEFDDIEKIILEGFSKAPEVSTGNEKGTIRIFKTGNISVNLDDAEIFMTCFGAGDKYNQLVVQILNPLTNETVERIVETRYIQSIVFK